MPHNVHLNQFLPNGPPSQLPLMVPSMQVPLSQFPNQYPHNAHLGQHPLMMPQLQHAHNVIPGQNVLNLHHSQHQRNSPPGQLPLNLPPGHQKNASAQHSQNVSSNNHHLPPNQHGSVQPPNHQLHTVPHTQQPPNLPQNQHSHPKPPDQQVHSVPQNPQSQHGHHNAPYEAGRHSQAEPQKSGGAKGPNTYDFADRCGQSNKQTSMANLSTGPGRDRSNLRTLTGGGVPQNSIDIPTIVNSNSNAKKKRNRKKKADAQPDSVKTGSIEAGSDMDIDEDDSVCPDAPGRPEEKYAEEIKSYLRLTQKKDGEKEKLVALKSEMSRISKLQADLLCLRKKFPEDPTLGRQLSNAAKLYEEAKKRAQSVHTQSESLNQEIFKIPQKIKLLAMEHEAVFRDKINPAAAASREGSKIPATTDAPAVRYVDRGEYFCSYCKQEFKSISAILSHLHSNPHILNSKQTTERPWASHDTPEKNVSHAKIAPSKIPSKGAQFLIGVNGFFCRLCKSMFPDNQLAEQHVLSEPHNRKYKEYTGLNPFYERRVQLEKEILVHTVTVATAPRQPASQIKSPSQPPGVESEPEKVSPMKAALEELRRAALLENESRTESQESNQSPSKVRPATQAEKEPDTTFSAAGIRTILSPKKSTVSKSLGGRSPQRKKKNWRSTN
ncbi:zinc finger protein 318 [Galendromus occidentalis]|uniref:Zinc finger protein 318 n=1 Tax=Galendromus occidentalis TaxID=34638 RepID=A0AAJ7P9J5_9ACAR|nr:zinc finger protein 318 [Galendromus occidentalis]